MNVINPRSFTAAWMGHFSMGPLEFLNTHTKNTMFEISALKLNTPGESRQGNFLFQWFSLLMSSRILLGCFQHICAGSLQHPLQIPPVRIAPGTTQAKFLLLPAWFWWIWAFPRGAGRGRGGREHFPCTPALPGQIHSSEGEQSIRDPSDYHRYWLQLLLQVLIPIIWESLSKRY